MLAALPPLLPQLLPSLLLLLLPLPLPPTPPLLSSDQPYCTPAPPLAAAVHAHARQRQVQLAACPHRDGGAAGV